MTSAVFPRWTRIVAPIAALWYGFGLSQAVIAFLADAGAAPVVIWVAYGAACFAGILGSAALFFAPSRASLAFGVSLIAAVIYFGWLFVFGAPTGEDYGIGTLVMVVTLILMLATRRFS